MEQVAVKRSGLAVASLVLALIFFLPLLSDTAAIILGAVALVQISRSSGTIQGRPLAIAGVVIGALRIVCLPMMGILAAMLLPALSGAKEHAREANCASNIHQLLLAIKMYSMDFNESFPMDGPPGEATEVGSLELLRALGYGVSHRVFVCPASAQRPGSGDEPLTKETCSYRYILGLTEADDPDSPVIYCEHHGDEGMNIGYVDGHVKREIVDQR